MVSKKNYLKSREKIIISFVQNFKDYWLFFTSYAMNLLCLFNFLLLFYLYKSRMPGDQVMKILIRFPNALPIYPVGSGTFQQQMPGRNFSLMGSQFFGHLAFYTNTSNEKSQHCEKIKKCSTDSSYVYCTFYFFINICIYF